MRNGDYIVSLARDWLGTPYRHQSSLKGVGCDCLGLIRGIWREVYGAEPEVVPAYSPDWAEAGGIENLAAAGQRHLTQISTSAIMAGDVLLFRWRDHLPAKHAAIVVDRTRMIHAQEGVAVCEVPLNQWWQRRIAFAFRFPEIKS